MSAPIALRDDFSGADLRLMSKRSRDPVQVRRLLALAEICEGGSRSEAARTAGVGLQTVRDWVLRFNAGGPEALCEGQRTGRKTRLEDEHRKALVEVIEAGPLPAIHEVVRWRLCDLKQWLWEEYRIVISVQSLSRELRALDYRKLSARPCHPAHDGEAQATYKTTSPSVWQKAPSKRPRARP